MAFLILTHYLASAEDQLLPEERERLRRVLTMKQKFPKDGIEMRKAAEIAARAGAADLLEAAINNPDFAPSTDALELLPKSQLTVSEKRRILIAALINPSAWANYRHFEPSRSPFAETGWYGAVATRAMFFRGAILDAFGKKLEEEDLSWGTSQEARVALAKEIGGPEVVAALNSPDGARRVGPPKEHGAEVHGIENGGTNNPVAAIANAAKSNPRFSGWALGAGVAAAVAATAGWLLLRRKGGGGKG